MKRTELQLVKFIATIAIIIPFTLVSCKDDDPTGASIVGTWKEVSYVATGCTDPDDNENTTCTSSCEQVVITDSTITTGGIAVPYTISGNQVTVKFTTGDETVTVDISETTLVVTQASSAVTGGCKSVTTYQRI